MGTPNAYGGHIVTVESTPHPKGLRWEKVTWDYQGKTYTAKCVPGHEVNRAVYLVDWDQPMRIILNGRSQVIFVEPMEA